MATNSIITPSIGSSAALRATAVTTSDTVDLPDNATRGLYVGATGTVKVDMVGGGTVTFVGVPAGAVLPIQARRVYATGTTATTILALW